MPFSAPALMSKLDVVEVGKTNYFVVWGIHGTKMKESLSYFFYGEDTHTHTHTNCPAWQPRVNKVLAQVTKKG